MRRLQRVAGVRVRCHARGWVCCDGGSSSKTFVMCRDAHMCVFCAAAWKGGFYVSNEPFVMCRDAYMCVFAYMYGWDRRFDMSEVRHPAAGGVTEGAVKAVYICGDVDGLR